MGACRRRVDVAVLAGQEVEQVVMLKEFNRDQRKGLYRYVVRVECNDPRFIDVGLLSKLPIGAIGSFQASVHVTSRSAVVLRLGVLT